MADDDKIIKLYFERNELAIAKTKEKYEGYCMKITNSILSDFSDCEECINETWLKIWESIPPHIPENFRLYIGKIARNLSFNRYKMNHAQKRGNGNVDCALDELEECITAGNLVEEEIEKKELVHLINQFMENIPYKNRIIFVRRYWHAESIRQIAESMGITEANAKMTLSRVRKKLGEYLRKEGYHV